MAKKKAKIKAKVKAKIKSKVKTKVKAKVKTKAKAKAKAKVKTKVKAKAKTKVKTKAKASSKKNLKSKSKVKPKRKIKPVKKAKSKRVLVSSKKKKALKSKSMIQFSDEQKSEFLVIITKLINLHKSDMDGLKSLTQVERILDKYNQHYTTSPEKFDAIVKYGIAEDPDAVHKHVYAPVIGKDKEINDIYRLLVEIGKGKIKYTDAKIKFETILQDAQNVR